MQLFIDHEYISGTVDIKALCIRGVHHLVRNTKVDREQYVWVIKHKLSIVINQNISFNSSLPFRLYMDFQILKHLNAIIYT